MKWKGAMEALSLENSPYNNASNTRIQPSSAPFGCQS
jgi:hypothetical protein